MGLNESERRREDWLPGRWIALGNGQSWCFPPQESVHGHAELAAGLAGLFADNMLPLINIGAIANQVRAARQGDPEGVLRSFARGMALYRVVFAAGRSLLSRNYELTDAEIRDLMPFDFDLGDPAGRAKLDAFGPETAEMTNTIASISGVDLASLMDRIGRSN